MPAALMPVRRYACTFKGCAASFDNLKDLRKHKRNADEHEYCSKCDEDFDNWDDFVAHKASSKEHISCKFCGEDFKTNSGRDRHIKQVHPVDQNLTCIGCGEKFVRAAALVDHLEMGRCKKIKKDDFIGHVQHKNVITRLLKNPELITSTAAKDWKDASKDNSVGGGVSLGGPLPQEETEETPRETQERLGRVGAGPWDHDVPTIASIQGLIDASNENEQTLPDHQTILPLRAAHRRAPQINSEAQFPSLGVRNNISKKEMNDTMKALRANLADLSLSTNSSVLDKGKGKEKATAPSSHSPWPSLSEAATSCTTNTPTAKVLEPWGNGATTASSLFSGATATPVTADWDAALRAHDEFSEISKGQNMFYTRFWDPTAAGWDSERFFNPIVERYECPLPQCDNLFTEPFDLEGHIRLEHKTSQIRCPSCLKLFKSTTALVSHCEAPNARCRISKSSRFGQAIDEFSGGFLGARTARRPDINDTDTAHTSYTKYEATKPPGWKSMEVEGVTVTTVGERGMGTATRRVVKGKAEGRIWNGSRQKWVDGEAVE